MSSFTNNIYGADRAHQSVAVLGGATAQSYGAVGLSKPPVELEQILLQTMVVEGVYSEPLASVDADVGQVSTKSVLEAVQFTPASRVSIPVSAEELPETVPVFPDSMPESNPDLMSRYESTDSEIPVLSSVGSIQSFPAGENESGSDGAAASASASLLSFIEQVIAQAQASQNQFNGSLDGQRQGSIIDQLDELASGLAEFSAQPIGSLAAPQLDSAIANLQDELSGLAG